jgi:hypothetical protein
VGEVNYLEQLFEVEAANFVVKVLECDEVEQLSTFDQLKNHVSHFYLGTTTLIKHGIFFKVNQSNHVGVVESLEYVDFSSDSL